METSKRWARKAIRRPGVWVAGAVAVVVAIVAIVATRPPTVTTTAVSRKDLEQHIVASGRVWVPTRVQISAQTAGLVLEVSAVEGQRVHAGDPLVQLDDAEARAAVAQSKAAVDQSAARVEQLRKVGNIVATETLRQADTNLAHAEAEAARVEKLVASGSVARTELDDARRSLDLARAQKKTAQVQQIASAPMGADSRLALGALVQAQAQLTAAALRLAQTRIVARQDGVILSREVEPGDVVQAARRLLVIAADADAQLVIEPDERNLAWVKLGQRARASADAYPEAPFDAELSYIAPSVDPQRGSIEVRLRVPTPPPFLKPDMTVSVDLTVAAKKLALVVASDGVRGAATTRPVVLVVSDGRVAERVVTLGIHGEGHTEILSGVDEGAEVVTSRDRTLTVGQRVRPVRGAP